LATIRLPFLNLKATGAKGGGECLKPEPEAGQNVWRSTQMPDAKRLRDAKLLIHAGSGVWKLPQGTT